MRSEAHVEKDTWYKDREGLRENDSAIEQHQSHRAPLKDYSLKHRVSIEYDMNEDSIRDRMFILKVGDHSVILDWEEVLRVGRFI